MLHVPNLATFEDLHEYHIFIYIDHLKHFHDDTEIQFKDLLEMGVPSWVIDSFETNEVDVDFARQWRLIELQSHVTARAIFKHRLQILWTSNEIIFNFPLLWEKAKIYKITFPTTCLVESWFSRVTQLLSKARKMHQRQGPHWISVFEIKFLIIIHILKKIDYMLIEELFL